MITRSEEYSELAKALQIERLFFKREDLHPYGSHKGRSIPKMIDTYVAQGIKHFVITGSGNAALAASYHIEKLNKEKSDKIELEILVGQHISTHKLRKLEQFKGPQIKITMHDRPLQTLFNIIKDDKIRALRQSTDDLSLEGYSSLAEELLEIPDLQTIFIGTSSGTTAEALANYFNLHSKKIEIHIVQTPSCHPIADTFVDSLVSDERSVADAIVDHVALRKDKLIPLIKNSGGSGWIASNEQIGVAKDIVLKNTNLSISTNSALSVAGLMQAVYTGRTWKGSVVCIICGD